MPLGRSDRRHLALVAAAAVVDHLAALAAIACLKNILSYLILSYGRSKVRKGSASRAHLRAVCAKESFGFLGGYMVVYGTHDKTAATRLRRIQVRGSAWDQLVAEPRVIVDRKESVEGKAAVARRFS